MKKLLYAYIIILSIIILSSCSYGFSSNLYYKDLNGLCEYVNSNIVYVCDYNSIYKTKEYFQSPVETEYLRTGDCEDFSIYFMYLAKQELNIKPDFVVVWIENKGYHALTSYDGVYYDPTNLYITEVLPDSFAVLFKIDYNYIMIYSTRFFTKGV